MKNIDIQTLTLYFDNGIENLRFTVLLFTGDHCRHIYIFMYIKRDKFERQNEKIHLVLAGFVTLKQKVEIKNLVDLSSH